MFQTDADVNSRCFDGNTALHVACGRGLVGMVALLMAAGANPDIENEEVPSEESDNEEEGEEQSGGSWNRRGLKPADYIQNNERVILPVIRTTTFKSVSGLFITWEVFSNTIF